MKKPFDSLHHRFALAASFLVGLTAVSSSAHAQSSPLALRVLEPAEPAAADAEPPAAEPAQEPPADPPPPVVEPEPEPPPMEVDDVPEEPAVVEAPPPEPAKKKHALDPKVNFGVGLRTDYNIDPGVGSAPFSHFVTFNIRPYISGQVNDWIKFEANLDSAIHMAITPGDVDMGSVTGGGSALEVIRPLDAVIKFEPHPLANFWAGRFLPPTDRANLSGPYFQNAWNYPVQANLYPAIYAGRHNGLAYWGQVKEGRFKWQLGMFDLTGGKSPLLAGKLVVNILDKEPGYYNASTYYGAKDILAIGAVVQYQNNGDPTSGSQLDGVAANGEILFEKVLGKAGVLTVEAAYYNFQNTDLGHSFNGLISYLAPGKQGAGTLQPMVRLQYAMPDGGADPWATIDGALNYIVNGHGARFALNYQYQQAHDDINAGHLFTLGGQLQL